MAECMAFNQTIGFAGGHPAAPAMVECVSFYRRRPQTLVGSLELASVAVLRSYPSITYHQAGAQLSAITCEQA